MKPLHTCEACGSQDVDVGRHVVFLLRDFSRTATATCLDCGRITAAYWNPARRTQSRSRVCPGLAEYGCLTWAEQRGST